jgi:hypothetical protein
MCETSDPFIKMNLFSTGREITQEDVTRHPLHIAQSRKSVWKKKRACFMILEVFLDAFSSHQVLKVGI